MRKLACALIYSHVVPLMCILTVIVTLRLASTTHPTDELYEVVGPNPDTTVQRGNLVNPRTQDGLASCSRVVGSSRGAGGLCPYKQLATDHAGYCDTSKQKAGIPIASPIVDSLALIHIFDNVAAKIYKFDLSLVSW